MMSQISTLWDLLRQRAATHGDRAAIVIPCEKPWHVSYYTLKHCVEQLQSHLMTILRPSLQDAKNPDAVCLVFPNTLEFVVSFFAVTGIASTAAAPLNPEYTEEEFEFYITDLNAKAILVPDDKFPDTKNGNDNSRTIRSIINIATKCRLPVLQLSIGRDAIVNIKVAYNPTSATGRDKASTRIKPPAPNDVALILHTSGTTSRPKAVPLSHNNLVSSMDNISQTYSLQYNDRTLVVMPLFHVHGLIGCLLSTLYSGGSAVIPVKFSATHFLHHLLDHLCTWYSAVPTIHKILLSNATYLDTEKYWKEWTTSGSNLQEIKFNLNDCKGFGRLRFIRSASATLSPAVFHQMKQTFNVPIVEAYAMTEAAHQMTSNPLGDGCQKPGSAGIPHGGVQVAIFDNEHRCAYGQIGEVCVKGRNVTSGYLKPSGSSPVEAFNSQGWFRTGDQGYIDSDGYLFLTGRLKELINRGGEKISPLEIDDVLLRNPRVADAVSFGVDDALYGQQVNAAVVLKKKALEGENDNIERELQNYCRQHLASFKIPQRIFVTEKLPTTATGKIQRRHVANAFSSNKRSKL